MEQAIDPISYLESKQISPSKIAMIKKNKQIVRLWELVMKISAYLFLAFFAVFVIAMCYFLFQIADELLTDRGNYERV